MEKLLCIKRDNNVSLYKVSYKEEKVQNLIDNFQNVYAYKKEDEIATEVYKSVPLSMDKYDSFDFCHVEHYEIIDQIPVQSDKKICRLKINISIDSVVGNMLTKTFINDDILLNMTDFYKIVNHILGMNNTFKFNEKVDLRNDKKKWNDLGRVILNELERQKYLRFKKESINVDDIVLNNKEDKNKNSIYEELIKKLNSILLFEQVGMFPVQENNDELYEIFEAYGERNKTFEFYFGSLERENVRYNMNGGIFINNISDEVVRTYGKDNNIINENTHYLEFVKSKYNV